MKWLRDLSVALLFLASWCPPASVLAQTHVAPTVPASSTVAPSPAEPPLEASVKVANRTVAVFRGPFLGVGAAQRAQRTRVILQELVRSATVGQVTVKVEPQGHVLLIDGELAFVLTPLDTDVLRSQTLAQASSAAREALQQVLAETREGRDTQRLMHGLVVSLAATVLAMLVALAARRIRQWVSARLGQMMQRQAAVVKVAGAELLHTDRLVAWVNAAALVVSWTLVAVVAYHWLSFVLRQFPYSRPWGEQLTGFLLGALSHLGLGVAHALPDLFIAVAIFFMARAVIAMFRPFFARVASGHNQAAGWLDADTARPTSRLFNLAVWLFAVVMAYPYLPGADSEAFKGMSVLIGLMVTVGGSSLVSQAASGMVLMYSRTLRVGEYVRINDQEGTVTEMGAFTMRIRTGLGEELTLPNALVLGTVTKNYSRAVQGSGFVLDTTVTIGYDTPWRQVEALLMEAARRTPGVIADPAPRVFQTALADFYTEYRLVCHAIPSQPRSRAEVLSVLHAQIQDAFNEVGVQIMSPHYRGDPAAPKVVPREAWFTRPASEAATTLPTDSGTREAG
jgi:small-conductance mechanosensitive channel